MNRRVEREEKRGEGKGTEDIEIIERENRE